jgi:hypothetical protein
MRTPCKRKCLAQFAYDGSMIVSGYPVDSREDMRSNGPFCCNNLEVLPVVSEAKDDDQSCATNRRFNSVHFWSLAFFGVRSYSLGKCGQIICDRPKETAFVGSKKSSEPNQP